MTTQEIRALENWLKDRPHVPHVCACIGSPEAAVDTKEQTYECAHGKRLKWADARRAIGLPI